MRKTIYTDLDAIFGARFVRENELNFIATRDMLTNIEKLLDKHSRNETKAHTAEQIKYTLPTGPNTTVHKELHYQNERVRNLVLGNLEMANKKCVTVVFLWMVKATHYYLNV